MPPARPAVLKRIPDDLNTLATDPNDNVREAVLQQLVDLKKPEAIGMALTSLVAGPTIN